MSNITNNNNGGNIMKDKNYPIGIIEGNSTPKRDLLDYSLREIQQNPNTKLISQGNRTTLQFRSEEGTIRVDIQQYPSGETRIFSVTPRKTKENQQEFEKTIMKRLSEGNTQADVALTMGISQSRVSQIKKKYSG